MDDLPMKWTTRDGTKILISEMTDQHLTNCIEMLKRNGRTSDDPILMCGGFTGDMADYYFQQEFSDACRTYSPGLDALETERNGR